MAWRVVAAAALAVLALQPAWAADETLRLEPSSEWVLDYADERCSLHRRFGEADDSINLRIDWFGPLPTHRILLVGPAVPHARMPTSDLAFRFTPDPGMRPTTGINGTFLDQPAVSFGTSFLPYDPEETGERKSKIEDIRDSAVPKPADAEFERNARSLEVTFENGDGVLLELGSMAKPLAALRTCMDNLQSVWGLDPAVQAHLSRRAVPKPSTVRRVQRRYPPRMAMGGINAFVPVRVMVDARGEVTDCVVQSEGIEEAFTDAVCDGLARGYEPALDVDGNPVASVFPTSVIYLIQ